MSIRFKMTTIAVAVILVANSLLSFLALRYLGSVWLREVQTRVQRNLNSARAAYQKHVELISAFLRGTARDGTLARRCHAPEPPGESSPCCEVFGVRGDGLCRLARIRPAR